MRRRGYKRSFGGATAYRRDERIVIEGLAPGETASTSSDLLVVVEEDTDDLRLGRQLLSVLESYGKRPRADQSKALLAAFGVSSQTRLIQSTSSVSVALRREYDEVMFSPYRKHPPGGWVGNVCDPVYTCPAANVVAVGMLLRRAFDLADGLPPGR